MYEYSYQVALAPFVSFAETYSCGAYGADVYSSSGDCSTSTTSSSDPLADTGYDVLIPLVIGILLIVISVGIAVYSFISKRRANRASQTPPTDATEL